MDTFIINHFSPSGGIAVSPAAECLTECETAHETFCGSWGEMNFGGLSSEFAYTYSASLWFICAYIVRHHSIERIILEKSVKIFFMKYIHCVCIMVIAINPILSRIRDQTLVTPTPVSQLSLNLPFPKNGFLGGKRRSKWIFSNFRFGGRLENIS